MDAPFQLNGLLHREALNCNYTTLHSLNCVLAVLVWLHTACRQENTARQMYAAGTGEENSLSRETDLYSRMDLQFFVHDWKISGWILRISSCIIHLI